MRLLTSILIAFWFCSPGLAQQFVLINGQVIDGTGKARVSASVRVRDGKIAEIGAFKPQTGETVLDVKGMIVAPGVVDLQNVSPSAVQKDPSAASLIVQGVTTAVLGSDGTGHYSVEDYMVPFDEKPPALNIAMLVGHGTVRRQIIGPDYKRPATADEIQRMSELVSEAMKQGAFGLGSNLQQEPASFSTAEEVKALVQVMAKFGGTFVTTLRNESEKRAASVTEVVALARDARIPVQVLTTNRTARAEIEKSRGPRVDIAADSYSFAQLVGDKAITLERAMQRMSATPASRLALRERGVLKKGDPADIVVFNPLNLTAGMKLVFVNGAIAVKDGQPTGEHSGQALR